MSEWGQPEREAFWAKINEGIDRRLGYPLRHAREVIAEEERAYAEMEALLNSCDGKVPTPRGTLVLVVCAYQQVLGMGRHGRESAVVAAA